MFSFSWKNKEEREKSKKEKKDKKKESKRARQLSEPALTVEELGRLEEVGMKRGLFLGSRKKKVDITPAKSNSAASDASSQQPQGNSNLGSRSGSEQSLNSMSERDNASIGRASNQSTPSPSPLAKERKKHKFGNSGKQSPDGKPEKPVPPPKPRSILKGKSSYKAPPYTTVSKQLDDTDTLQENTLFNQDVPGRKSLLIEGGLENVPHPIPEKVPPPAPDEKSYNVELSLPSVAPPKPPRSRDVVLNRQPKGDYGFSLRRSLIIEKFAADQTEVKKYVHFAEPGNSKDNVTGLLPGDRLVEVNGVNVEDMQRDEIVGLIRKSGDSVMLRVQPIPELSELSMRSGLDGGEVQLDAETLKSGSLQRSGSKRYKKTVAKTEDQLASEQAWLKAEKVWLVHKGGFAAAKVLNDPNLAEGKVKVKLEHGEEILEVDEEDVEKANPPHFDRVEDIATLRHLNESGVLHTLRQRYGSNLIHTYAGASLLVINPVTQLSIYAEKVMHMFKGCKQEDMPPHIYAIAQSAYRGMLSSRTDHSILLMGRSGSGKTANVKHVLNYLAHVAGSVNAKISADKINSIHVLIQAFGHSRTAQSSNATRCTQLYSLDFDHAGQIAAMSIQLLLLDRTRVVRRPQGEPNFNIFYALLAGADQQLRNECHLNNLSSNNLFLTPTLSPESKQKQGTDWSLILSACRVLGFRDEECKALWAVLAAIIHLGAAGAVKGSGSARAQFAKPSEAQKAATLLGTTVEELARSIFHPSSLTGTPTRTSPYRTGSPGDKGDHAMNAMESLEGMVMGLYSEVVGAVIGLINRALSSNYRVMNSMHILDMPGFQNPAACGRQGGASFQDLCDNYAQERLQLLFHDTVFTSQQDKYAQENIDCDFESVVSSPQPMVNLIDKVSQQTIVRPGLDSKNVEKKGLLWLLDEESIFPGANDESFMERFFIHYGDDSDKTDGLVRQSPNKNCFILNHQQGTLPVEYNATGWLGLSRENPVTRVAATVLQDSSKSNMSSLFLSMRGSVPSMVSGSVAGIEGSSSLRRASSLRRSYTSGAAGIKRKSLSLQVKFQVDGLIDQLRRSRLHFVQCLLPQVDAGVADAKGHTKIMGDMLNVPLLRSQIRGNELLEAVRIYRQGYPDSMLFTEFRRRFEILAPAEYKSGGPVLDEKKATQDLLDHLDIDKLNYRLGLSQVFFRSGSLAPLEDARDESLADAIIGLQAYCRGFLGRKKLKHLKIQTIAITCIQRNVRKYIQVRNWTWWRLLTKVTPLLDVHRTEEELRIKDVELEQLKTKFQKLERERNEYKTNYERLETKLGELTTDLQEEHGTATHASEVLEAETAERMRLEKELKELKSSHSLIQRKTEKLEMEVMESRLRAASFDGDMDSDEDDGTDSIYKQKYERVRREMEFIKKKLQSEHEEEIETHTSAKKVVDRKLAEALEEMDEIQRLLTNQKRKHQKVNSELQDMKLHLESQQSRNSGLEKKQRKFDAELTRALEDVKIERAAKEKLQREKEQTEVEVYQLRSLFDDKKGEVYQLEDKVETLQAELRDLSSRGGKDENEILDLKRARRELEAKVRDQEEELDDQAGTVQMLEQAKLRLEMQMQNIKQDHQKDVDSKEEEIEDIRINTQKRIKNLENQLDEEYMEKQAALKEKRDLERQLKEKQDYVAKGDKDTEKRLRKDLKKTKALLHDAQIMLDKQRASAVSKTTVKQLQAELEEAQYLSQASTKSRKGMEEELVDLQQQLEYVSKSKSEAEQKVMALTREKIDLQSKLDDEEEDFSELMRKHKAVVHQASMTHQQINDHLTTIAEITGEKQSLQEQVAELNLKVNNYMDTTVDKNQVIRFEGKIRDLESRLDLELTYKQRTESQTSRLKETNEKLSNERDSFKTCELQTQEMNRKLQRQLRDLREEFLELQHKEDDASRKKHELETQVEDLQSSQEILQSDLKLAFRRISDLQNALEDQLDEDSDLDDSGSDSDVDIDTWLQRHKRSSLTRDRGDSMSSLDTSMRYTRRRSPEGLDNSFSSVETPKFTYSKPRTFTSGSEAESDHLPNTSSSRFSDIDSSTSTSLRNRLGSSDDEKDRLKNDSIFSDDFNIKINTKLDEPSSPTSKKNNDSPDSAVSVEEYI
ncbi:unconventional myosin-XVIIIa-like isoform X2 [Glandiceps talaboti]